jgi:hypothetical protein
MDWSQEFHLEVNKEKSAIVLLKADQRTTYHNLQHIQGFPVVKSYKYLGLEIDNDLTLRVESKQLHLKEKKIEKLIKFKWARRLPNDLRYEAWEMMVMSKFSYGKWLACSFSKAVCS